MLSEIHLLVLVISAHVKISCVAHLKPTSYDLRHLSTNFQKTYFRIALEHPSLEPCIVDVRLNQKNHESTLEHIIYIYKIIKSFS